MKNIVSRLNGILVCLFLLAGILLAPFPAFAQGEAPPKPDFAFSNADVLVADPEKPVEFVLINKSTFGYSLELDISGFDFPAKNPNEKPGIVFLVSKTSEPPAESLKTVTLAGGGNSRLYLHVAADELKKIKPGTYNGFLVVSEPLQSQTAIQRAVQLVVKDETPVTGLSFEPLYETWTLKAVRNELGEAPLCQPPCYLPLKVDAVEDIKIDAEEETPKPLGYLVGPDGRLVEVLPVTSLKPENSSPGVELQFNGLSDPGVYTAKLDLLPNDKDRGAVTLTVNVTDHWILPVFVLIVGILIAMGIQRYVGVGKKIEALLERKRNLENHPKKSVNFMGYSLNLEDFGKRISKLNEQLEQLDNISAPVIEDSNKDYQAAQAELDALEKQIQVWEGFEGKLLELEKAIAKFGSTPTANKPAWPRNIGEWPASYLDAKKKMAGEPIELEKIVVLDDKVQKATKLLGGWGDLNAEIQLYRARIVALEGIAGSWPEKYKEDLYAADRLINQAWGELWLAADADDLKIRCTAEDIDQVEALLLGLNGIDMFASLADDVKERFMIETKARTGRELYNWANDYLSTCAEQQRLLWVSKTSQPVEAYTPSEAQAPIEELFEGLGSKLRQFFGEIGEPVKPPPGVTLNAKYPPELRWWREAGITGLALVIAISTAMTALYIGKNFGTFMDYLTIFTWGVTSKALVEGIDFAVGRFKWSLK
ncbi:MAG: hypothetical protein C3F07_10040 [Anaerolineales bacterium]|nr:MAG: hypothetical protein C3F07_10040 [Anaerolineales bacterium]